MARRDWTRDELILAMNLYCQLPFGRLHHRNPEVMELASAIGRTPSSVAMKLCNLAALDPTHQQRGVKGLSKVSSGDRQIWDEFHADWTRLAAESEALRQSRVAVGGAADHSLGSEPVSPIEESFPRPAVVRSDPQPPEPFRGETESSREVRVRLAQRFFRRSVLASYNWRCCISDIALEPLLIASHILPWSAYPQHRANSRNGLCLSRLHDAAFDRGLIAFDTERRLIVSRELREQVTNRVLNEAFQRFEGEPLRLPEKFLRDIVHLSHHRVTFFRG